MRFEHLVQVNDPLQPLLTAVSRAQLWRGLVRRAESPAEFVLGLSAASIESRVADGDELRLERTIDFGSFRVRDRVRLDATAATSITDIEPGAGYPACRLTIRIEEPAAGRLFLRFVYESAEPDGGDDDELACRLRRQAYRSADIDTIWRIRDLVERGELG